MKKLIYTIGGIVALAILGGIIYFGFLAVPGGESPAASPQIGVTIPAINMAPLGNENFASLKIYKSLPLAVGLSGNPFPFQEIILIAASETAAIVQ